MIIRDNFCKFCIKIICSDLSSEPSKRDGSVEGSQHMVRLNETVQLWGHNIWFW